MRGENKQEDEFCNSYGETKMKQRSGGITSIGTNQYDPREPGADYEGKVAVDVYVSQGDTKLIEGWNCKRI